MKRKEIKLFDLAHQQMKLDFEQTESKNLNEIESYLDMMVRNNNQIFLCDLTTHFARRPYGWQEWQTVLLVFRLFIDFKIYFVINGAKIQAEEAKDYLTKSAQWKNVKIIKRKVVEKSDLQNVKNLCKDIFGSIGPEGQDELSRFLRKRLRRWKKDLSSFKQLADTGIYPGKSEIDDCLNFVWKLLAIRDPYELIKAFIDRKNKLLDVSCKVHRLKDFYKNQIETWNSLLKAVDEFMPNQTALEKDHDAAEALCRIFQILNAPSPYSMLKDVCGLISRVKVINDALVDEKRALARSSAIEDVENMIAQVCSLLNEKNANSDLKNQALFNLQKIKKKLKSETSIPNIDCFLTDAEEQFELSLDLIDTSTSCLDT